MYVTIIIIKCMFSQNYDKKYVYFYELNIAGLFVFM